MNTYGLCKGMREGSHPDSNTEQQVCQTYTALAAAARVKKGLSLEVWCTYSERVASCTVHRECAESTHSTIHPNRITVTVFFCFHPLLHPLDGVNKVVLVERRHPHPIEPPFLDGSEVGRRLHAKVGPLPPSELNVIIGRRITAAAREPSSRLPVGITEASAYTPHLSSQWELPAPPRTRQSNGARCSPRRRPPTPPRAARGCKESGQSNLPAWRLPAWRSWPKGSRLASGSSLRRRDGMTIEAPQQRCLPLPPSRSSATPQRLMPLKSRWISSPTAMILGRDLRPLLRLRSCSRIELREQQRRLHDGQ